MSRHEAEDFAATHVRRLGADGCPDVREQFIDFLDRTGGAATAPAPSAERAGAVRERVALALIRLDQEYPHLAACVRRRCIGPLPPSPLRAVAQELGVCHRTVRERTLAGVAQLVIRSGVTEEQVIAALRTFTRDNSPSC